MNWHIKMVKTDFLYNQHNEIIDSLENDEYFCN